jgi:hypothetical protein
MRKQKILKLAIYEFSAEEVPEELGHAHIERPDFVRDLSVQRVQRKMCVLSGVGVKVVLESPY